MVDREKQHPLMIVLFLLLEKERSGVAFSSVRACLHEGGGPQVGDVNVIKLKREIEWKDGLLHLSEMQHLPGFPHLHVNRPLEGGLAGGKILSHSLHTTNQLYSSTNSSCTILLWIEILWFIIRPIFDSCQVWLWIDKRRSSSWRV